MRAMLTALLVVVFGAGSALAQGPTTGSGPEGYSAPPKMGHERSMPHAGMHGGPMHHAMMGAGSCPMMGEGMAGGAMGPSADPRAQSRMLRMRGDMMRAMGDVMLKHADEMDRDK